MAIMAIDNANWLGTVPNGWKIVRIGDCYKLRNEKVSDVEYPPLSVTMKGIVPQLATAAKTDDHDNRKLVRKGDFAINSRSDRRGSCGISDYEGSVSLINTVLTPRDQMNPRYYNWLFHTEQFADEFYKWGHGIVDDLWTTRWQEMKSILIVSPPLSEQSVIADYLDDRCAKIDEIITKATKSIEEYKQLKQSVIFEAVTKGLDKNVSMKDSGINWIGEIPTHWNVSKLKTKTSMLTPMRDKPEDLTGEIPWVRIVDFDGKYISDAKDHSGVSMATVKKMNLKIYPVGTVLCTSSCDLGKCAIVSKELVSNQRFIGIIPNQDLCSDYLYYLMLSNSERLNMLSRGTIQANLSRVEFEQLQVQFPPVQEQRRIAIYLDKMVEDIEALISEKQALIDDLQAYKKSLIYEVVTGKRKVV